MAANDRFYSQKIKTFFMRFDHDKNGHIEVEDFEKWALKLAKIGKLNSFKSDELLKSLLAIWRVYFEPADTNHDGSVDIPELIIHMKNSVNDLKKKETIQTTLPLIFDAIDTNKDHEIGLDEFTAYFQSLGINDSKATSEIFSTMDMDDNGVITLDEFSAFGLEFFTGQNQTSPARFFFGPLL